MSRRSKTINGLLTLTAVVLVYSLLYSFPIHDILINQNLMSVPQEVTNLNAFSILGKYEMKSASVSILGVGRNVANRLPDFFQHIDLLSSQFHSSQLIFVEGDSTDDSASLLNEWASLPSNQTRRVFSINCANMTEDVGNFKGKLLPREGRISMARNLALSELFKLPKTDYIIWVDMDVVGWDLAGVYDSFGRNEQWDAICAHGILLHGIYRDLYALRVLDINTNHHGSGDDHELYGIPESKFKKVRAKYKRDKRRADEYMNINRIKAMQHGELKPFHVDSCFGGMAVYRYDVIAGCDYQYRYPKPPFMLDCEHVLFNKCIREKNNARIMSNPNMKLWYGHTGLTEVNWSKLIENIVINK